MNYTSLKFERVKELQGLMVLLETLQKDSFLTLNEIHEIIKLLHVGIKTIETLYGG